jgi:hypothetical protein
MNQERPAYAAVSKMSVVRAPKCKELLQSVSLALNGNAGVPNPSQHVQCRMA